MSGVAEPLAREAMRLAAHKLPIETKFLVKGKQEAEHAAEAAAPVTAPAPEAEGSEAEVNE
jgi:large subunit ribosomal protein L16